MKRDLDLVRMILLEAEEADGRLDLSSFVDASHSLDLLGFHVAMMADAGLVDAEVGHAMVLALLCRILAQWGTVADSKARCRATRTPTAERHFSGGRGAVDASIHSTTKVVRR